MFSKYMYKPVKSQNLFSAVLSSTASALFVIDRTIGHYALNTQHKTSTAIAEERKYM